MACKSNAAEACSNTGSRKPWISSEERIFNGQDTFFLYLNCDVGTLTRLEVRSRRQKQQSACLPGMRLGKLLAAAPAPPVYKSSLPKTECASEVARLIKYTDISTTTCKNIFISKVLKVHTMPPWVGKGKKEQLRFKIQHRYSHYYIHITVHAGQKREITLRRGKKITTKTPINRLLKLGWGGGGAGTLLQRSNARHWGKAASVVEVMPSSRERWGNNQSLN